MEFIDFVAIILVAVFSWATHSLCYTLGEMKGFRECEKISDECIEEIKRISLDGMREIEAEVGELEAEVKRLKGVER